MTNHSKSNPVVNFKSTSDLPVAFDKHDYVLSFINYFRKKFGFKDTLSLFYFYFIGYSSVISFIGVQFHDLICDHSPLPSL